MTALVPPLTSYKADCAKEAPMKTGMAHLEMTFKTFGADMAGDCEVTVEGVGWLDCHHVAV